MFKRVDQDEEITGFSYENKSGDMESVVMRYGNDNDTVEIFDSGGDEVTIYREDIPNLIKALQAAYDFKS